MRTRPSWRSTRMARPDRALTCLAFSTAAARPWMACSSSPMVIVNACVRVWVASMAHLLVGLDMG